MQDPGFHLQHLKRFLKLFKFKKSLNSEFSLSAEMHYYCPSSAGLLSHTLPAGS
jgi:hypothetical protein